MGAFFKPWRRKLGVVTLGLACVFVAGWVKSYRSNDECVWIAFGYKNIVYSLNGKFGWLYWEEGGTRHPSFAAVPLEPGDESKWLFLHDAMRIARDAEDVTESYWVIILPLTLLSAWLLLTKPRASKTSKSATTSGA